jgi:hypothetical protein
MFDTPGEGIRARLDAAGAQAIIAVQPGLADYLACTAE